MCVHLKNFKWKHTTDAESSGLSTMARIIKN